MGGPGYLEQALKSIRNYTLSWFIFSGLILVGLWFGLDKLFPDQPFIILAGLVVFWLVFSTVIGLVVARQVSKPLSALSSAIMHVSPTPLPVQPPDLEKLKLGKDLVTNLTRQVYEYASQAGGASP